MRIHCLANALHPLGQEEQHGAVVVLATGVAAIARIAAEVNAQVENIGARRLYTVMERVFEELSFTAPDRGGEKVVVDAGMVEASLGDLVRATDVRRYVL